MESNAVVITGLGMVTPIGTGKEAFWQALRSGQNGLRPIRSFDTSQFRTHCGGEVPDFEPSLYCRRVYKESIGRGAQLAIASARMALDDAGLNTEKLNPARVAVAMGTTMGESQVAESYDQAMQEPRTVQRRGYGLRYPSEVIPAAIAREFEFEGPISMMATACAAGNYAIGHGMDMLAAGEVDVVIAGGADPLSHAAFMGFNSMHAVTPDLCQPFDRLRKGMAPSEGSAALVLETYTGARKRGAHMYCRTLGYGIANDGYHMTAPHPQGRGAVKSIQLALHSAGVEPAQIDYINAHGTGTPANDRIETMAIKRVFGEHAYKTPVSSIKSMIGHTMGAASAIEAAACVLAIEHSVLPPTINYRERDPECDLDYVPNSARDLRVRTVLSNSFAFGGNCACLILQAI